MNYEECPTCGKNIKSGIFSNEIITDDVDQLNKLLGTDYVAFCTGCHWEYQNKAASARYSRQSDLQGQITELGAQLNPLLSAVPMVTLLAPPEWKFDALSLITAQSVSGTGLFSEIGSVVTDALGRQSGMFKNKLANGERLCLAELRSQALRIGGNAIIGIDVDYAEVGGARSMLMVCMTGTAIRLRNLEVLGSKAAERIRVAEDLIRRMATLEADK